MFKLFSITLMTVYGISWAWAATASWHTLLFLSIVGMLASLPIIVEGLLKALPYMIIGAILPAASVAFPYC